jgi:hypothetical protein
VPFETGEVLLYGYQRFRYECEISLSTLPRNATSERVSINYLMLTTKLNLGSTKKTAKLAILFTLLEQTHTNSSQYSWSTSAGSPK